MGEQNSSSLRSWHMWRIYLPVPLSPTVQCSYQLLEDFHLRLILDIPTDDSQHKYSSHVLWAAQPQREQWFTVYLRSIVKCDLHQYSQWIILWGPAPLSAKSLSILEGVHQIIFSWCISNPQFINKTQKLKMREVTKKSFLHLLNPWCCLCFCYQFGTVL